MEPQVFWSVAFIASIAVGFSYGLTWLARFLAPKLGLMDTPDGRRKLHASPTPLLGGVAVFCAVLCTILCMVALRGVLPR